MPIVGSYATQQDEVTTWLEHLDYEYWWYGYYAGTSRSHRKRHNNAGKKFVDSKVLRPGKTEFICDFDAVSQRSSQKESAKRASKSVRSAAPSAETIVAKWRQAKLSPQTLQQRPLASRPKLGTAKAEYESLKRHNDCIPGFIQLTRNYRIAKRNADHHGVLQ